jgi:putative transcriptional regulator
MVNTPINLTNQFLIAMPGMAGDTFEGTVIYLCEHTENGALGLVINKPIDIKLKNLFEKVELNLDRGDISDSPVFLCCMSNSTKKAATTVRRSKFLAGWR